MKKIFIPVYSLILIVFLSSFIEPADRKTKKYSYQDFKKVEASSGMLLNITQSSSYSIEVNAEEADFEYLKVDKKGSTLEIYIDKNNYKKSGDIKVDISLPELTGLELSGGSQGKIKMDSKNNFECGLSGGSEVSGNLNCEDIDVEISGGGTISLSGEANNLSADGSGGSIFHLKNFNVKNVDANLSGGSRMEIKMNGTLNVDASGGSRVVYYGNAKLGDTDFSGGSGISSGE